MAFTVTQTSNLYIPGEKHPGKIDAGSVVLTKADVDRAKKKREQKRIDKIHREEMKQNSKEHGGFTFMQKNVEILKQLSPSTVGRLVYLSTYLDYDNHLVYQSNCYYKKPICKRDLQMVMGLGKTVVNEFYKECEDYGIINSDDIGLTLCDQWYRGSRENEERTRIYIKTVRNLYSRMKPTQHKYFGYITMLLPYINKEWNIVCSNPNECDPNKVKVLSVNEICNILGFNDNHKWRLIDAWSKATFMFQGEQHYLCGYIGNGDFMRLNPKRGGIVINPHILFTGSHLNNVGLLTAAFNLIAKTRS